MVLPLKAATGSATDAMCAMQSGQLSRQNSLEYVQSRASQLESEQQEASARYERLDTAHTAVIADKVALAEQLASVQSELRAHRSALA